MTKTELIETMAADASIPRQAAGAVLDSFMAFVAQSVRKQNRKVMLPGFGTFYIYRLKARKGYSLQTGEVVKRKARNVVKFRPSKKLKSAI